jgi:hypothetical protein
LKTILQQLTTKTTTTKVMKNRLLIASLFLTLLGQTAFAQRRLSPSVQQFAENWHYSLVDAMYSAGFDMPTKATKPVVANLGAGDRNVRQLDSTKTYHAFNQPMPGDSTPLTRTIYQYPSATVKIETNYLPGQDGWQPLDRETLISDDQQRLTEVLAEAYDPIGQSFQPDSRLEIFPHGDSDVLVDSFFTYLWDSTILDWRIILSSRYVFDSEDRLIESINSIDYFGDPAIFQELYYYDANGDNHLIEEFAILGNDVFPSSRTDIKYAEHRPIEALISVPDGTSFIPDTRTNYAYTLFGKVRKQMNFEWNAGVQHLYQTIDYAYDNQQRLFSLQTTLSPAGQSEQRYQAVYVYLANDDLFSEWTFNWDDDLFDWKLDSRKHYFYSGLVSGQPDPVTVQTLMVSPNPAVDFAQLQLKSPAHIQLFNTNGELVLSAEYRPDQLLNLGELPSGLYFIAARAEDEVYAGRIVKL